MGWSQAREEVEVEQQQDVPEERFIKNAAVLPDRCSDDEQYSSRETLTRAASESVDEPLLIHGRSVTEYQQLFHSIVDPMMHHANGTPLEYTMELGREIKQKLWEAVSGPTYSPTDFTESYSGGLRAPTIMWPPLREDDTEVRRFDVDIGLEPWVIHTGKKRGGKKRGREPKPRETVVKAPEVLEGPPPPRKRGRPIRFDVDIGFEPCRVIHTGKKRGRKPKPRETVVTCSMS